MGEHGVTLELVHRKRCTEGVSHDADEISQHVVSVLELHRSEVPGVAANVGDQQIAPFDVGHSGPLATSGSSFIARLPIEFSSLTRMLASLLTGPVDARPDH